jgi:hypothetical protein
VRHNAEVVWVVDCKASLDPVQINKVKNLEMERKGKKRWVYYEEQLEQGVHARQCGVVQERVYAVRLQHCLTGHLIQRLPSTR